MIRFDVTVYTDIMSLFRGEFGDKEIREEIQQRFDEYDDLRELIREDLPDETLVGRFDRMSAEDIMRYVTWNRDDSELDYDEMYGYGSEDGAAIRLGCIFDEEKALSA